jgi:hypothetical protein
MAKKIRMPPGVTDQLAKAEEALEAARRLPPGLVRNEALKQASLLRQAAYAHGIIFARKGRPPKEE